ncbi:M23 family metallopeptidase [Motilibacter deserti]|uniref:M23 family metallopeptidase n=1 Tax=Motilibacter deserti TaxID=2714956 RepID=UPI002F2B5072
MSARRTAGKHRRPGRHRSPATGSRPSPPVLFGTAVVASAAAYAFQVPAATGDDTRRAPSTSTDLAAPALSTRTAATPTPTPTLAKTPVTRPSSKPTAPDTPSAAASTPAAEASAKPTRRAQRATRSSKRASLTSLARARRAWVEPLSGYRITAHFGQRASLWSNGHTGTDLAAPTGTPVHAVGDAVVVSVGYDGAYGNKIVLRHNDGTETWYGHLSATLVDAGQKVIAGTLIGRVGATGHTTGPHLHLEVRPGAADPVDAESWLREHGVVL